MREGIRAALVTGANRGLGMHIVTSLLEAGVPKVYAGYRTTSGAPGPSIKRSGVVPLVLDVTCASDILAARDVAADVNLLINNAGVLPIGGALDVSEPGLIHAMAVNYFGPLAMIRAFAPAMKARRDGTIVNVLTLLSLFVEPRFAAYCASKWASWAMTQALRAEFRGTGVRLAAAFPGGIDTDMLADIQAAKAKPTDVAREIVAATLRGEIDIYPDPASRRLGVSDRW